VRRIRGHAQGAGGAAHGGGARRYEAMAQGILDDAEGSRSSLSPEDHFGGGGRSVLDESMRPMRTRPSRRPDARRPRGRAHALSGPAPGARSSPLARSEGPPSGPGRGADAAVTGGRSGGQAPAEGTNLRRRGYDAAKSFRHRMTS